MNWLKNFSFLKGVGVGFILSGLLFALDKPAPMTNQEIINRASELGMVAKDQVAKVEPPKEQKPKEEPAPKVPAQPPTPEAQVKPESKAEPKAAPVEQVREVVIPKGSNSTDIARILKDKGFIKDTELFLQQVDRQDAAKRFKAGTYQVPTNTSVNDIIKILTKL